MTSIGELKICSLLEEENLEYCRDLTRAIMVRTYPAGLRTDSSNYTPTQMWNAGCQVGKCKKKYIYIYIYIYNFIEDKCNL